jgi:CheY-like chemotaxis protein
MDDQKLMRDMVGRMLTSLGYEVVPASEGNEAVDLYKKALESGRSFAAVILDLTIPGGMGGAEAVEKLREIDPEVRAIVSSGYANDPIMAEYREHGFSAVVVKPYEMRELSETLHRIIQEKEKHL